MARTAVRQSRSTSGRQTSSPARRVTTRTSADRRVRATPVVAPVPKKVRPRRAASPIARAVTHRDASRASRRWIGLGVFVLVLLVGIMMTVVVAQTYIAENQLRIDRIERDIASERDRYNSLRLERSTLREPSRLVEAARALGMQPGVGVDFTSVDPMTVAAVLVATGGVDPELLNDTSDPLREYGEFKSIIGGRP